MPHHQLSFFVTQHTQTLFSMLKHWGPPPDTFTHRFSGLFPGCFFSKYSGPPFNFFFCQSATPSIHNPPTWRPRSYLCGLLLFSCLPHGEPNTLRPFLRLFCRQNGVKNRCCPELFTATPWRWGPVRVHRSQTFSAPPPTLLPLFPRLDVLFPTVLQARALALLALAGGARQIPC